MKIGFIGAGNMGTAYISALSENQENEIFIYEISEEQIKNLKDKYILEIMESIEEVVEISDIVFLAVKPNILSKIIEAIGIIKSEISEKVFISIAAGIKLQTLQNALPNDTKLVRVMPNTPALIGKGVSGVTFCSNINDSEKLKIIDILKKTGEVFEVEEEQLEILTAISGSGPAFVLLLINSIADGGVKLGMKKDLALKLASKTFSGTAEWLMSLNKHPEELKDMVTSPGGTTAAGLYNMEKNNIRKTMIETVEETYKKAKELGKRGEK